MCETTERRRRRMIAQEMREREKSGNSIGEKKSSFLKSAQKWGREKKSVREKHGEKKKEKGKSKKNISRRT